MSYEKIILGRIRCEKASQVVTASFMTFLFMRRRSEKEKEENTWRRKISFVGKRKTEKEKEGMSIWRSIFLWKRRKAEKEKEENIWRRNIFSWGNGGWMGAHSHAHPRLYKRSLHADQKILSVPRSRKKLLTKSHSALGLISISYLRKHSQTGSTNDFPKSHFPVHSTFFFTKKQAFTSSFQYLDEINLS